MKKEVCKVLEQSEQLESSTTTETKLSVVRWYGNPACLDLRKWYISDPTRSSGGGMTIKTVEGADNLVHSLVKMGFGEESVITEALKTRGDKRHSFEDDDDDEDLDEIEEDDDTQTLYDPKNILL